MSGISKTKLVGLAASFTAAPVAGAQAQDGLSMADEFTISVTGGILWSNSHEVTAVEGLNVPDLGGFPIEKLGLQGDKFGLLDHQIGGYGQIAVNGYPGGERDWRVALSGTFFPDNSESGFVDDDGIFSDDGFYAKSWSEFHYLALDFDVGKTNKITANDYNRLSYGVRGLYAGLENGNTKLGDSSESIKKTGEAHYWGVGPYVRGEISHPLNGGNLAIVGSADGSLLYGALKQKAKGQYSDDDGFLGSLSHSETEGEFGYTVGGTAGLSYLVSQDFQVILGYRVEMLGIGEIDPVLSHGATLTGKWKF